MPATPDPEPLPSMPTAVPHNPGLAAQARRYYVDVLVRELPQLVRVSVEMARGLMSQVGSPDQITKRRDLVLDLPRMAPRWQQAMANSIRAGLHPHPQGTNPNSFAPTVLAKDLALVDDDTIEVEILSSRLGLAMMDKASWEFADLRFRMSSLERREELDAHDVLRPNVLARFVVDAWRAAGLTVEHWRTAQGLLHEEFAALVQEAFHECNRWLIEQRVCPDVNLRPFIRRGRDQGGHGATGPGTMAGNLSGPASGFGPTTLAATQPSNPSQTGRTPPQEARAPSGQPPKPRFPTPGSLQQKSANSRGDETTMFAATELAPQAGGRAGPYGTDNGGLGSSTEAGRAAVHDETRMMTRSGLLARGLEHAEAVIGRLNRLVNRQVPEFGGSTIAQPHAASPALRAAIGAAQVAMQQRFDAPAADGQVGVVQGEAAPVFNPPVLLREMQQQKQELKDAATTPVERATIEVVALMFQALLTEERIPPVIRVWFARLQMPVLRVAIVEPDFFATIDHPARKLIDRMGACVMGFEGGSESGLSDEPLEKEIKRVVQVVEAYPDTGRRVFQTVLTEFERFLENYFKTTHAAASKGVSLAQQIEQRETLAIQYTIEMRKMLNEVPVHDGVREFLFQVWADVLATTAVKAGQSSEQTKRMHKGAAELIWLASAKVSREERSEAIRRLPPLLKLLREGMAAAGVPDAKQDEYIQALNNALAAAFSARSATIPTERLDELRMQLETLEDLLPEVGNVEIDESMVRDLSGEETAGLEVVSEGGSMPTPAIIAWARDLQVGTWFKLDYNKRVEPVQLAWQGMRKQLSLFVAPQGRALMFQQHRLASYLQAGLLVPAQEESLTVRATRDALAKLDADPSRLLQ
ncbi:MAG: hypothetical protein RIQ60_762 [Pseudomonadota bacterium]